MKEKIIEKINNAKFVSGQQIADELKISRTAVFKHVKSLEELGFIIEIAPRQGYRLLENTPKLHPLMINKYLKTEYIGREMIYYDEIDSTINIAKARNKAAEGLVVIAEKQRQGRGRFGRDWNSSEGGIYTSILLKPKCPMTDASKLNFIASLVIADSIENQIGIKTYIKWPNDIIVENKKVAGILTDISGELDEINYAILSFGVNVNNNLDKEVSDTKMKASSLKEIVGSEVDRVELFCLILNEFEILYKSWQLNGLGKTLDEWRSRCLTIGKQIEVSGLNRKLKGVAKEIDDNGHLILVTSQGKKHTLTSGDITILNSG